VAKDAHSPTASAFVELTLERVKGMAYLGPLLCRCMDKIYYSTCNEREGRQGMERWPIGSNRDDHNLALTIVVRQLGLCGEGVGHRLVRVLWQVPSGASTFLLSFPSLCSILPAFFWLSSAPFPHSFSSSSSSPSGTVLSCEQAEIDFSLCPGGNLPPTVLCSLTPPYNKAPSHKTKPIHQLADLRNG
jgi:hypothetical protein